MGGQRAPEVGAEIPTQVGDLRPEN